jgi:transposase
MKIQEVILRAMSGDYSWVQAGEIIGLSPRSMRRWRRRYELRGYDGLLDRRRGTPSPRKAPFEEVQRVLRLYRQKYHGFNVRHFHQIARREHGVRLSYSFVKKALQGAGLVKKRRAEGVLRRDAASRREPPCVAGSVPEAEADADLRAG